MKVIAKRNRELTLINTQNTQNENRAETIELLVPEEYESFNKKIVFITPEGNVWDVITNNTYKITNAITKYKKVEFYIWLTKEVDGESIDFRTKTKTLNFYHNEDASDEITPEEISGVNTVVNILEEEITKVDSLETELRDLITDIQNKSDNGEFDGDDGYTPQKGVDYFTEQDIEEIEGDILNEVYTKEQTDTLLDEKADIEDIPDVSSFITKDVNDLTNYTLKTNTGSLIDLEINDTTYVVTLKLKTQDGTVISTDTIDLPLESVVVGGNYDSTNKKIVLTLENGNTVDIPVGDLIAGLQTEITSSNKLASDLVDDTNSGNKFVTTSEKNTWNAKYDKPSGGIPKTDLASDVQTSLGKADTAIQSHQDISGKEDKTNKVTSISSSSTDTQYPSAKCVYDSQEEQNTEIEKLQTENARLKATLPTTTGEGQDVTLNKTAEMEFVKPPLPMGNSEKFTTTGKNLFSGDYSQFNSVGGTGNLYSYFKLPEDGETYTLSLKAKNDFTAQSGNNLGFTANGGDATNGYQWVISNGTTVSKGDVLKFSTNTYRFISLYYSNSNVLKTLTDNFEIQLEKGSTRTEYEPYTNGASPNPDYPQEITNVTGDVEVVVGNKNLCKNVQVVNNVNLRFYFNPKTVNKNIMLSFTSNENLAGNSMYLDLDGVSKGIIGYITGSSNTRIERNITFANEIFNLFNSSNEGIITIYKGDAHFITPNNAQIENGSTATDYVEHKSQAFIFPLGNEKLMLGDYLADDGIHHVRGQVVLNGTETWWENTNYTTEQMLVASAILTGMKTGTTNIISSIAKYANPTVINSIRAMGGIIGIGLDKTQFSTVSDFTTWLSTHNTTVEYELEEEVIVPYTSAQQEVYNQIKRAISYEEQTNISSNQIALFNVEAYQDAKVILAEKGTYSKPSTGIPKTDLASAVQTSLNKADSAIQEHQDISGKANKISVVQTSTSAIEINSNTFYKFGEVASLNITLASITDNTIYNEYMFEFVSGLTATTLTLPSSIKWLETPTIDANKIYQCSIVDNVGLLVGVANV